MNSFMRGLGLGALLLSSTLFAALDPDRDDGPVFNTEGPFDIAQLPKGASVTLPSPATTFVPVSEYYRLAPTDKAQVFRISAPANGCSVEVKVFDKKSDDVKILTLQAGQSMIYRFERLNGVRVHATPLHKCKMMTKLIVDSNRPLELGF